MTTEVAPWATIADVCSPCDDYAFDTVLLESRLQMASEILFNLTKRRWAGEHVDVVRPCARAWRHDVAFVPPGWDRPIDLGDGGWWGNVRGVWGWCGCTESGRGCGCVRLPEIGLPNLPVVTIDEVRIDGAVLTPTAYTLDDDRYLVRIDGDGWPCCQDLTGDPLTDADTFQITYTYGSPPPEGGIVAAATLACELALACSPETIGRCRLPKRVQSISRQGVTVAVIDSLDLFTKGLVGIPEVDMWIQAVNRGDAQRRSAVILPDLARRFRRRDYTPGS